MHKHALLLILILVAYAAGIVVFSQCRSLDRDEGYYAAAARLVAEGKMVYRDFFYPQAPALPYLYAPVDHVWGSLGSLRLMSAGASVLMLLLWGVYLADRHGRTPKALFGAMLLVALDPHLAYWNVTVKTFGVGNLLLTATLVSLYFALERRRIWGYALSGLASGLLISVRLLYAPIAPLIFGWLLWRSMRQRDPARLPADTAPIRFAAAGTPTVRLAAAGAPSVGLAAAGTPSVRLAAAGTAALDNGGLTCRRPHNDAAGCRFAPAAAYLAGLAVAGIPFLVIFLSNPQATIFNNLGYHALRATPPGWLERAAYVLKFLAVDVCDPYLVLGLVLAVFGCCSKAAGEHRGFVRFTVLLAAVFALGAATPYPLNAHYFTGTLAPFLLPAAALGIATIGRRGLAVIGGLLVVSSLVMVSTSPFLAKARLRLLDMASVYASNEQAAGGRRAAASARSEKSMASFDAISRYVASATEPNDVVLSFWPGYVYQSRRQFFPGLENDFGLAVSSRLSAAERNAYRIAGRQEVLAALKRRLPKAVVIGGYWMADLYPESDGATPAELSAALDANYSLGRQIDGIRVYLRRE
ncbi:MAG: hypothetical protein ABFC96_07970 [Thermoguttaceae bacterium]